MININRRKIMKWIIAVIIIGVSYPIPFYIFWWILAFGSDPDMPSKIRDDFRKLPSKVLINRIKGYGNPYHPESFTPYPFPALQVLMERKEKEATPILINFLKSRISYKRRDAIWALGVIGDERAIEPLMKIVKKNGDNRDYLLALEALSKMHYDKIYPTILQMEKDDFHTSWVVDMLENFPDKPETLPLLRKISKTNSENYIRDKAKMAIEHIKATAEPLSEGAASHLTDN